MYLCVQKTEGTWICELKVVQDVDRQLLIRLADFITSMCISAILSKLAQLLILVELALLSLEIVVWYVQHFVLNFNRQRLQQQRVRSR